MNLTTEQKKAAALIFAAAADGKPIEWNHVDAGWIAADPFAVSDYANVRINPHRYRIAPDPIAPGWNPAKLTVAQVGEGWRLLDEDEYVNRKVTLRIERWFSDEQWDASGWMGSALLHTYRTRLTRAELAALDAPPFDLRNLPGFRALLPGEQWHRDDWTREMLPEGWRPILSTECAKHGDQYAHNEGVFETQHHEDSTPEKSHNGNVLLVRTKRPLPPIPTRRPWTFENAPLSLKVRRKLDGELAVAHMRTDGYLVCYEMGEDHDDRTFASMLENFECLDGSPCGTVLP